MLFLRWIKKSVVIRFLEGTNMTVEEKLLQDLEAMKTELDKANKRAEKNEKF